MLMTRLPSRQWDDIPRMIATIKLKEVTASDLFRRLHSYSKQHASQNRCLSFASSTIRC